MVEKKVIRILLVRNVNNNKIEPLKYQPRKKRKYSENKCRSKKPLRKLQDNEKRKAAGNGTS